MDSKLLAEEKRLQELIDAKEKQRFELVNSRKIEDPVAKANAKKWEKEVSALLNQQKELQTKIRTSSPKYAELKYPEPDINRRGRKLKVGSWRFASSC